MRTNLALEDPVRRAVRVLMAVEDETQADLTEATGIPKSTLIRRMRRGGWSVQELQALALHFRVEPAVLLGGAERLLTVPVDKAERLGGGKHSTCSAPSAMLATAAA